jgi:hypothetical protein
MERLDDYLSVCAAAQALAPKPNIDAEELRRWIMQVLIDTGQKIAQTRTQLEEIEKLNAENRDVEDANEARKGNRFSLRESSTLAIDEVRPADRGVESTCQPLRERGLESASRSYWAWKKRPPATRVIDDAVAQPVIYLEIGDGSASIDQ